MDTQAFLDRLFNEWSVGKTPGQARIGIFEKVRDIPYAVVPDLIDATRFVDILALGRGSCTPKHFLLAEMFQRLGLLVLFAVFPFHWGERADSIEGYPPKLKEMARHQPLGHHLACRVEINGRLVLVDATLDKPLARLAGMPVNLTWDGFSDTLLPMTPCGEEDIFHPVEAYQMKPRVDEQSLAFYDELNTVLEEVRRSGGVNGV